MFGTNQSTSSEHSWPNSGQTKISFVVFELLNLFNTVVCCWFKMPTAFQTSMMGTK
jgi:hypothetical protein